MLASNSEVVTKLETNNPINTSDLAPGQSSAVDPKVLDTIRAMQDDDDPNLLSEMITLYLATSDKALEFFRGPDVINNADELRKVAHSLKGSSASIGATRLAACCLVVENLCKQEQLQRYSTIQQQLEKEYAEVYACLSMELQGKAA